MENVCLVTGAAGFIGYHLATKLLAQGQTVVGIDDLNDYYSVELKEARLALLKKNSKFTFQNIDISNPALLTALFSKQDFNSVYHLAAQAGVRFSIENPHRYLKSNIDGTLNLLEAARKAKHKPAHLLLASSSSVYGLSTAYPLTETDSADRPVSIYGMTKRANELTAHTYSHLHGLRISMLRFFTVYGPWGRPDMAPYKFVKNILSGEPIEVFNNGDMIRDFTYVDDIVEGMVALAEKRNSEKLPLYDVFNIGCSQPRTLMEFVASIEKSTGKKANLLRKPFQSGDIYKTFADVSKLQSLTGYKPQTSMETGVSKFVEWFKQYYAN